MSSVRARSLLLLCLFCPAQAAEARRLLVICIDGLDARYLRDADKLHLKIPTLRKLMKQGAVAEGVAPMLPDGSWAANATVTTGVGPTRHRVVGSELPTQTARVQTLWQAARAAHQKTALIYWPGTVNAEADFLCPQYWEGNFVVDPPFDTIAHRCTPGLIQRVATAYPTFVKAKWSDASALQALRYLLQHDQPDLALVHLGDLEGEENETGALSIYSRDVLENDDDLIGQALEKRPPHTVVAIVSDHGFDTENYVVRPKILAGSAAIEVKYGLIGAKDAEAAAALRKGIGSKKWGIAREVPMAEVAKAAPDVTGWVAAFATMQGYVAAEGTSGKAVTQGKRKGVATAWPVRAAFVLSGEGVKAGKLGEISMLDIAPTLAAIIQVKLPAAQGRSLVPK